MQDDALDLARYMAWADAAVWKIRSERIAEFTGKPAQPLTMCSSWPGSVFSVSPCLRGPSVSARPTASRPPSTG